MISNEKAIELSKKYGTPLYVYNAETIRARYQELKKCITYPKLRIYYAMKANYNPEILKILEKEGAYLDTVSPGDVLLALKVGFTPDRILYTANNLTDEEMHEVKKFGVLLNIDSLSRLEKFGKAYPGSKVCIRVNPDVVAGEFKKIQTGGDLTKFGILLKDVDKVNEIVQTYDLKIVGIHEHTGSGIVGTEPVYQSMRNVLAIATPENFPYLEFVDFGGGFKVPYEPGEQRIDYEAFGKGITEIFENFCKKYGKDLDLYFEPGKFIVAEAGSLLIEVNTIKDNNGRNIAGTNSGFPQLIRPMFYGAYHEMINTSNPSGEKKVYDICGNICETGDCFATDRELPEIREGDILKIENAGAYCYVMGGVYNLRAMPAEVIVDGESDRVVRKKLSSEELIEQIVGECQ